MPSHEDFPNNIPCPNTDPNALQNYTQKYRYDELGNIKKIKSISSSNTWVRRYKYDAGTNRLLKHQSTVEKYTYDAHGNMLSMPHLSSMQWDEKDQLHSATNGTFTSYYNYDAQSNRTRKVVEKGNIIETRYYFNGYEIFRKEVNGTLDTERTSLHISDLKNEKDEPQEKEERKLTGFDAVFDKNQRIILIETLTVSDGNATDVATVRYQYSNHLGSACLELDENGQIVSYEEYHPFGTTSYRSGTSEIEVSLKRYKYVGKERDEETGLYYYGARYYAAWLCRFVSVDPLQFEYPELTPYQYASNRPVTMIDLDGTEAVRPAITRPSNTYRNNTGRSLYRRPSNYAADAHGREFPSTRTINNTSSTYMRNNSLPYGQRTIISEIHSPYVTDYKAIPEVNTVQITSNNSLGKILALAGEKVYQRIQVIEDRVNTPEGMKTTVSTTTSIEFANFQNQAEFDKLQQAYELQFNKLVDSMEDIEIPNSEWMLEGVKALHQQAAKVNKATEILGPSPKQILQSLLQTDFKKVKTTTTTRKFDIPEIKPASN
jgi:RHS repeat-associated protein